MILNKDNYIQFSETFEKLNKTKSKKRDKIKTDRQNEKANAKKYQKKKKIFTCVIVFYKPDRQNNETSKSHTR